ncbi:MAG: 50S ribosomal protein L23 [Parachlamydiaceae bacterium]|nr:50S ribosomal protein L23 [Parachlamydiaceae bacterium]
MSGKSPYQTIKYRHITEKSTMLENLQSAESNPSLKRCESPKFVFIVDSNANKLEIKNALEQIYSSIKVMSVNTINVKGKRRRVRGKIGYKNDFKKAVVTLRKSDTLDHE